MSTYDLCIYYHGNLYLQIWELADYDCDGNLTSDEFAIVSESGHVTDVNPRSIPPHTIKLHHVLPMSSCLIIVVYDCKMGYWELSVKAT